LSREKASVYAEVEGKGDFEEGEDISLNGIHKRT